MKILKCVTVTGIPGVAVTIFIDVGAKCAVAGSGDIFKDCNCRLESLRIQDFSQFLNFLDIREPPLQRDRQGYFFGHKLLGGHLHCVLRITHSLLLIKFRSLDLHV